MTNPLKHIHRLAVEIGARPATSPQERAAADYGAEFLRSLGLDVTLQHFRIEEWAEVGRLYWDIILASDSPFRQDRLTVEAICPFRYDFYQLMRNQVLAHCIQRDRELNYGKVEFGVMYHGDNDKLMDMRRSFDGEKDPIKAWQKLLRKPSTFHSFTIQRFLSTIEPKLPVDLVNWRRYLKEKHLL